MRPRQNIWQFLHVKIEENKRQETHYVKLCEYLCSSYFMTFLGFTNNVLDGAF